MHNTRRGTWVARATFVVCSILATAPVASADTYGFGCISNNSVGDCAILEAQMSVEVTSALNTVQFTFRNSGPAASSITDVYFDDLFPPLLGLPATITGSSGVSFSAGCSPGNLPAGSPYNFTTSYCADSNSPVQPNGVNPTEWLRLSYTLQGTATLADVLREIDEGDYRIGIRVQGFASGGSESGILVPPPPPPPQVPEPTSLFALASGLLFVPVLRRRRQS